MNNHIRNQHYVPQFLLKNFTSRDGKFIWAYDKNQKFTQQNRITERAIKKVASEEFFYDPVRNDKAGSYEYAFQKHEDTAATIIKKIIKTRNLDSLLEEERSALAFFVTLQHLRTKRQLNQTEDSMAMLTKELENKVNIKIPNVDSRAIWFSLLDQTVNLYEILLKKVWMLIECDNEFHISDHPVTLQNTINATQLEGTLGLDCYGIEIYLPISPSLTICMFCEKVLSERAHDQKCLSNLYGSSDIVKNLNFLQILYSQRFIFSHKNDFEFVRELLKDPLG